MVAGALITTASTQSSFALSDTNLVPANVQLTCVTTNSSGNLVYERVGTWSFIKECASEMGITNLFGLSLVQSQQQFAGSRQWHEPHGAVHAAFF